jgi:hypothetical protein
LSLSLQEVFLGDDAVVPWVGGGEGSLKGSVLLLLDPRWVRCAFSRVLQGERGQEGLFLLVGDDSMITEHVHRNDGVGRQLIGRSLADFLLVSGVFVNILITLHISVFDFSWLKLVHENWHLFEWLPIPFHGDSVSETWLSNVTRDSHDHLGSILRVPAQLASHGTIGERVDWKSKVKSDLVEVFSLVWIIAAISKLNEDVELVTGLEGLEVLAREDSSEGVQWGRLDQTNGPIADAQVLGQLAS